MIGLEGEESLANAVAKLAKNGHHAVFQRRCAAFGKTLADGQQCACWQTGAITRAVNDARTNTHFLALLLRGARRFSRSSSALTRRLARLRSVTMPDFFPYSWPLKKARPTSEAVMPVPMMTVSGSMLGFPFC